MSAVALQGLLDYLLDTLSVDNRRWLAEHLIEPKAKPASYTREELASRAEQAVQEIQKGNFYTEEQMEQFMDEAVLKMQQQSA